MELKILEFYRDLLLPLTPGREVSQILQTLMSGGETTQEYARVISTDPELQKWLRINASRMSLARRQITADHLISLLGVNRVRNMIIGRNIERSLISPEKTLIAPLEETYKAKCAEHEALKAAAREKGEKFVEAAPEEPAPDIKDFARYLIFAIRAESVATEIKSSYPGQAFAGGILFDYVRALFSKMEIADKVTEQNFKKPDLYIEEIFNDGLRCALAAEQIIALIQIAHQRSVFVSALVRNLGKPLLLAYDPVAFERAVKKAQETKEDGTPKMTPHEAEVDEFDMDHAQLSALFIGRMPFLQGIEKSLDYHHEPKLLKSQDADLYSLACLLRVSGMLVNAYQAHRITDKQIKRMPDPISKSPAFAVLKLNAVEWEKIKTDYMAVLTKTGL